MIESDRVYPLPKSTRQALLADTAAAIRKCQKEERRNSSGKGKWEIYDSYLENPSDDSSFYRTFGCLLPEKEQTLAGYIERLLVEKRGVAIGIEFGGPGSNLFGNFSPGFFGQTLGVTLNDLRSISLRVRDNERHHAVIAGDMFSDKTQQEVTRWLRGRKADVIFERMNGGLNLVPPELRFLSGIASNWYQILAEGGVMFVQIPGILVPLMVEYKDFVDRNHPSQIQIEQILRRAPPIFGYDVSEGLVRLNKLRGAPPDLPLLHPRIIKTLYKNHSLRIGDIIRNPLLVRLGLES